MGFTFTKTSTSPDTICKKIKNKISDDDCTTRSEGCSAFLTNLIHKNMDKISITMPRIVCMYLKGPNITNKKLESNNGFSFLNICSPPLISVPMIISIKSEKPKIKKTHLIFDGYLLFFLNLDAEYNRTLEPHIRVA